MYNEGNIKKKHNKNYKLIMGKNVKNGGDY